jgi:hypothetical protein
MAPEHAFGGNRQKIGLLRSTTNEQPHPALVFRAYYDTIGKTHATPNIEKPYNNQL